jgi:signal transduction histidine kinase
MRQAFASKIRGIGIPEGQRQRVFERFAQTEPLRGDGLGLGLSLVQRICDRQGWLIEVQGLEAGGTCFSVNMSGAR